MKKVLAIASAAAVCCKLGSIKCYAWGGVTHRDIVSKALDLLEKEKKQKVSAFFKDYHKQLEAGCTAPDSGDDIDCGAGMLVSRNRFTANGCGIIIAVDDKCINDVYFGKAVVYRKFCNNNNVSELNECRDSVILPLSDSLEIDRFTLLCALYEECGYRQGGIPLFSGTDIFKEKTNT